MEHCTQCGSKLPSARDAFCQHCGSKIELVPIPMTSDPDDREGPSDIALSRGDARSTARIFLENAHLGLTDQWRWILGALIVITIQASFVPFGPAFRMSEYIVDTKTPELRYFVALNLGFIAALIGVWLVVKLLHNKSLTQTVTGRRTFDYNRVMYAIGMGILVNLVALIIGLLFFSADVKLEAPSRSVFLTFFFLAIILTPFQAALEEIVFRGYITQGLSLATRRRLILVIVPSLFFMLIHITTAKEMGDWFIPYMFYITMLGMVFSAYTLLDGGIELAVGYHAAHNLWVFFFEGGGVFAPLSLFDISREVSLGEPFLIPLTLFFVFSYKYQWFSWRGSLDKLRRNL